MDIHTINIEQEILLKKNYGNYAKKFRTLSFAVRKFKIILFNWEYWNFNVIYFPIFFYWLWLSIKARSLFFFSTSNPYIEYGGFTMEKKKLIYDMIPKKFIPATEFIPLTMHVNQMSELILRQKLAFPLVAKPNIGERGTGVEKINSFTQLLTYQKQSKVDFLIQEWCDYDNEIGIFYCKYPKEQKGFITGIVSKDFLRVKGNGKDTVEDLLLKNDRFFLQYEVLSRTIPSIMKKIPAVNENVLLAPYGNHSRGSKFIDVSHQIDPSLEKVIDGLCNQIKGFYFGRIDIKFKSWELLKQGQSFIVIELNGAGSEPTHIYDPSHSIFYAWKEIIKHHKILYQISEQNKKIMKLNYISLLEGIELFRKKKKYNQLLKQNL